VAFVAQSATVYISGYSSTELHSEYPLFKVYNSTITVSSSEGSFDSVFIDDEVVAYNDNSYWSSYTIDISNYIDGIPHKLELVKTSSYHCVCYFQFDFDYEHYDFEVDGIRYNVISHVDFTVETTLSPNVLIGADGVINIPETVNYGSKSLRVIRIGINSFKSRNDLKQVIVANSVESIGHYAFYNCSALSSISAKKVNEVCAHAFDGCTSLSELKCDSNISVIGDYAFYNSGIEHFNLNENVQLGEYAFKECDKLSIVEFHSIETGLSVGLFQGCNSLKNLKNFIAPAFLPPYVFQNCSNLDISDILSSPNLKEISKYSLSGCLYNETTYIEPNIESIGAYAFSGFKGNLEIKDSSNPLVITEESFSGMDIIKLRLGRNLSCWNFNFSSSLTDLNIGEFVTEIAPNIEYKRDRWYKGYIYGGAPFVNCSQLKYLEIEPSAHALVISGVGKKTNYTKCSYLDGYIYEYSYSGVFSECPIKELKICRPINTINGAEYTLEHPKGYAQSYYDYYRFKWADPFYGISTIEDLTVDYNAFENVPIQTSLKNLTIDVYTSEIPDLSNCDIETIDVKALYPPLAKGFSSKTYMNCSLNVPIGAEPNYRESEIWNNFWNINERADLLRGFRKDGLMYFILPNNTLSVISDSEPYSGDIIIPEVVDFMDTSYTVVKIEDRAFADCKDLKSLSISGSVTELGEDILQGCSSLNTLRFEDSNLPVNIPYGAYDRWSGWQDRYVNSEQVEFCIDYYYGYFRGIPIEHLYLGRNLSDKSRYRIEELLGEANSHSYRITSYDSPFCSLYNLKDLTIGAHVSTLGPDEEIIEEVNLSVSPGSFKDCSSLKKVTAQGSVPPTGAEFSNTTYSEAALIVPDNTISLYRAAYGWKEFRTILDESSAGVDDIDIRDSHTCLSITSDGIKYVGDTTEQIYICGIDGQITYSGYINPQQSVELSKGVYVVKIAGKVIKIRL